MKGSAASPGIAIGKVVLKREPVIEIAKRHIEDTEEEIRRLDSAISCAINEIDQIYKAAINSVGEEAKIFEAHLMILDDPELLRTAKDKIKTEKVNAEWALKGTTDSLIEVFQNMDNEYMRERTADIKDVTDRIINILIGIEQSDLSNLSEEVIVVARDLTPSDTAQMDKEKVLGFVTEIGGRASHSAIMARTLGMTAVVGVEGITDQIKDGNIVVLDGEEGYVYINPDEKIIAQYSKKKKEYDAFRCQLRELVGKESKTKDGFEKELSANIGTPKDVDAVCKNDGEGIGLYRTEFLYMDRDRLPTEEEQFTAYKVVVEKMAGKPVVIRTLDIGGDKEVSYLDLPQEMNPFLGYRAIRLCLDRTDIFKTQLRALLRASACGNIKIMFPMISSREELRKAKKILEEVREELRENKVKFNENLEVGMMIEVPAAAIMSDVFAKEVDFFSIGTNDLIQYTTAVDRGNQEIAYLYSQFHPALLRLLKLVIDNGHKEGIWVGMCGEVAGDPQMIPLLIGMGLDEFSMSPACILRARRIVRNISFAEMKEHVSKVLNLSSASEVEKYIQSHIACFG